MNAKVLITGNLGYIGSVLLNEVKKQNTDHLCIDKEPQEGPRELCFNLRDAEKTLKAIKQFKPDVLVHAGSHSVSVYKDNFYDTFLEDFWSLANVLKAIEDLPDCRLIYFSSSYVYSGLPKEINVTEENALKPLHNFGAAKSFFEQFILRNHENSAVFRLSSAFGPGEAKNPNTILLFIRECLEKNKIEIWGSGIRKLQYVYNKDVIKYVFEGFNLPPGIYNLGGNEYVSVAEAGQTIADFFKAKVVFLKDKPEGETLPFLENKKLKTVSGKNFFTPFSSALSEYLSAIKNQS